MILESFLVAVIVALMVFLWLQHREAGKIAFTTTEFLHERIRALDAERSVLLTRIQLWEAGPPREVPKPDGLATSRSLGDGSEIETPDDDHAQQIQKRGLRSNTDGGYLDDAGHLFSSFAAYDEWIAIREANKLPVDADPRDFMAT